ncbi:MAG: cellobiose phosphorylase [Clostridiales bacterium]|jgi:cellobiose phosphorylase|nr:cellobiose phosphorylase [Clostridiales bacterium]
MLKRSDYSFNTDTGEFTLSAFETGKDWENKLWNDSGYQMTVTHSGCAWSRFIDDRNRQKVLNCPKANFVYIRDDDTRDYWNPGVYPSYNVPDEYRCVHGQDYSLVSGTRGKIKADIEFMTERDAPREVWKITLRNGDGKPRRISVFGVTAFDMNGFEQNIYYSSATTSATEYIENANAVFCGMQNPYSPFEKDCGFIMSSEKPSGYDGNLEAFLGTVGSHSKPFVLENGLDCSNSSATVRMRSGILQNKFTLKAGEEKSFYYILGFTDSAKALVDGFGAYIKSAEKLFADRGKSGGFRLRTSCPEARFNRIMNFWAQKQVSFCRIGKKAVRDNAQLAVGILNFNPPLAKTVLEECLRYQYSDGHAVLTYYPYLEKDVYSDPAFWLATAVCEYIKETGDFDFLSAEIPYLDTGAASVLGHLKKVADWYTDKAHYGQNGLPLIMRADWNDALNIPDENAESVFMAMAVCFGLSELAALLTRTGDFKGAERYAAFAEKLKKTINEKAYNGEYYIRAISKFGKVGDKDAKNGGAVYINPQTWAVLSGVADGERLKSVVSVIDATETDEGIPLCSPPYSKYDASVGRMSGMLAGVYENGGIYNHAGCFKVMADCLLKRGEHAAATLLKIIPDGEKNPSDITTTEPYVFTNCYLKHGSVDMKVGFSWQTGTSAWGLRCYYEGILGLKRTYDGLLIDPCFPKAWKEASAIRRFRGDLLNIKFINRGGKGVKIIADGKALESGLLPVFGDGKEHEIFVELI